MKPLVHGGPLNIKFEEKHNLYLTIIISENIPLYICKHIIPLISADGGQLLAYSLLFAEHLYLVQDVFSLLFVQLLDETRL